MIQLTRTGTVFSGTAADLNRLRARFSQRHHVRLSQLIQPELLEQVVQRVRKAEFKPRVHGDYGEIGTELCMLKCSALSILQFLVNNRQLFHLIESITGCATIGSFIGRVYRVVPTLAHYDSWHSDLGADGNRMVAMSINLSPKPYSGGTLQLRNDDSAQIQEIVNTGRGDGILFRLAPSLVHRITDVYGSASKTAFAGWFQSTPDFFADSNRFPIFRKVRKNSQRTRTVDGLPPG